MCSSNQDYLKDSWNFLKMRLFEHLFDDIVANGVTWNYSTKLFEKMRSPLGMCYVYIMNFKNMGGQVSNICLIHLFEYH